MISQFRSAVFFWTVLWSLSAAGSTVGDRRPSDRLNEFLLQEVHNKQPDLSELAEIDRAQLNRAFCLKRDFGDRIFPGFADAIIPLMVYNAEFAFLAGHTDPPSPWEKMAGQDISGKPVYRRPVASPQAFAVKVGEIWVGSLDTLGSMNRSMEKQLKEKMPPERLTPRMLEMFRITPAQHAAALLHEAFHAFQAERFPERFVRARGVYALEERYPYGEEDFKKAWNREGRLLLQAWHETNREKKIGLVREFLKTRAERRINAALSPPLIAFEQELEWLEGLAKYAEIRLVEEASSAKEFPESGEYNIVLNRTRYDLNIRLAGAADQAGDLRFYLTGAVQALLLDGLNPAWKKTFTAGSAPSLERLLQSVLDDSSLKGDASPHR